MVNDKQRQTTNNGKRQTTTNNKQRQTINNNKQQQTTNNKQWQATNNDKERQTMTNNKQQIMTNDKQNHFLNACHESWPPWYLDHLDYADQLNHSDNPDWSMINQNDNCRIRIGLVHVWNCFKEALTGSGCGDPEMSKKPRRNETRSYNAVDDILLRHMIMPHRGTGNPN